MKYFPNEEVICCDIDDTIVLWDLKSPGKKIKIADVHRLHGTFNLVTHEPHIRLVKEKLSRGALLIVWSQGGAKWAKAVLEAVGINKHPNRSEERRVGKRERSRQW